MTGAHECNCFYSAHCTQQLPLCMCLQCIDYKLTIRQIVMLHVSVIAVLA